MIKDKIKKIKQYPYNFVSFGSKEDIIKSKSEKGERKLGKNTGKFSCVLTTRTPLFIMGESEQKDNHTEEKFYRENGVTTIPASSLKGTVRNIIDALTNSAIRNVEDERLEKRLRPNKNQKVEYGIINKLPKNGELGVINLAKKIKIKRSILEEKLKNFDKNGKIIKIYMKKSIKEYNEIEKKEEYIKLLCKSDDPQKEVVTIWISSERPKSIYEKILLTTDKVLYKFSEKELEDFEYIIKQRSERDIEDKKEKKDFYYKPRKNNNKNNYFKLEIGDPIIIYRENEKDIEHLAFSEIPRLRYKYSPLDLVPVEFIPSKTLDNLSFSERMFGTVGDNTKNKDKIEKIKEMTALSGRVFFGDAKNHKPKMIDDSKLVTLKAFGEPHPTLTTFYLDNIDKDYNDKEGVYIRGRKFYWHHKDKIDKEFSSYRESIEMPKIKNKYGKYENKFAYNSSLELMDINNKFEFEVYFENLTDEELGVLIYGLELEDDLLHKIGKGKAFGFGSCKIEITKIELENKKRYESFYENKFEPDVDKLKYIKIAKDKYIIETKQYIKELKTILSKTNDLDFSKSPFPEEQKYNPRTSSYSGEKNTLNWFTNNKKIQLLRITDKNPEK